MPGTAATTLTLLLATAAAAPGVARGHPPAGDAPRLSLVAAGSAVGLGAAILGELESDLAAYFEECRSHASVVGEQPDQDALKRTWTQQQQGTHALLLTTGARESRHASLRGRRFSLLVGFDSEPGAWPVLTQDDQGVLTIYSKCSGFESIRISCQVQGLIPGAKRSAGCERVPQLLQVVDTAQLTQLEADWNDAHLRGDAEALDRLWAEDFVATVPGMAAMTKPQLIAFVRSGRMSFARYASTGLEVRVYGDAAVVTGSLERTRNLDERSVDDRWQFTKVCVRRSGAWRVVAFHASEAPP